MNKIFHKFITDNPHFWDASEYPAAVISLINDWFYYREICTNNDDKFARFLNRKLAVLYEQFMAYYSKINSFAAIDPATIEAMERTIKRVKNSTVGTVIENAIEESINNERTLNTANAKTGTVANVLDGKTTNALSDIRTLNTSKAKTGTENIATTDGGTVGNSGTNHEERYSTDYPQSSPVSNFENYMSAGVKIDGSTSSTETINKTGSHNTTYNTDDAETGTISDEHTGTVDVDNSETTTYNTNDAETGTIEDAGTRTSSGSGSENKEAAEEGTDTEEYTKTGVAVELFEKYFSTIRRTNAVAWLLDKLDVCFVQVLEFDDEEEAAGEGTELDELAEKVRKLTETVEKMLAGEAGPYMIFDYYSGMVAAVNANKVKKGSTMFVKNDDNTPSEYVDDGTGTNTTTLRVKLSPDATDYVDLTVSVGSTLERLSPQYNAALYTYLNQYYQLPATLTDIYDHYTIYNNYGNQVYPYYSYDPATTYYVGNVDFDIRTRNDNSFFALDNSGNIKFIRSI